MTKVHEFTLILGADPNDDEADQLYGVIHDATLVTSGGITELTFHREAPNLEEAVRTAVADVQATGFAISKVELLLEPLLQSA